MTGYARVHKVTDEGEITISVKSLNHRALNLHFHLVSELEPFESAMRSLVKRKVARGHLDVRVTLVRSNDSQPAMVNRRLLAAYMAAFREAASAHGIIDQPDLNSALRIPGMFDEPVEREVEASLEAALLTALTEALDELNRFREREGAEIVSLLIERTAAIQDAVGGMERVRDAIQPMLQARLEERLRDLLNGAGLDPQRLVQEAALLAERSDIGEELARLRIHADQLTQLLRQGGEIGKKLDFLLQEMNRETNTILSKSGGAGAPGLAVTNLALRARSDIEKIREQSLNLE